MERILFTSWSTPASGSRGAEERRESSEDDARQHRAMLRSLFEARFARLQVMCHGWGKQLPADDWRMRLLHKALFSTWADLRSLGDRPEVKSPPGAG